ncbi:MAG: type II toxin-antitoxin system ParD family antitoxin [Nitrospirales bacterium]|nr:type II toxin-antitoxin system ParD family antitoxin [Nitrospirales bacterium]
MHVSLTPELEALVKQHVQTGRYHSSSEVVREALRLWQEHEQLRALRMDTLRKEIKAGLDSGPAEGLDFKDVKKRGRARLKTGKKVH